MTKIPKAFGEIVEWMKPLCRFKKLEDIVVADYKEERLTLKIFTKDHQYNICARLHCDCEYCKNGEHHRCGACKVDSYLGCTAQTRKPRAGEHWNRGNDLADGDYSRQTFEKIIYDILSYELVKVAKKNKPVNIKSSIK